jgi:hypothetical protein
MWRPTQYQHPKLHRVVGSMFKTTGVRDQTRASTAVIGMPRVACPRLRR